MEQNQSPGETLMLLVGSEEGFSCSPRRNVGCTAPSRFYPGCCWLIWVTPVTPLPYCLCPCQGAGWLWGAFSAAAFPPKIISPPCRLDPVLGERPAEICDCLPGMPRWMASGLTLLSKYQWCWCWCLAWVYGHFMTWALVWNSVSCFSSETGQLWRGLCRASPISEVTQINLLLFYVQSQVYTMSFMQTSEVAWKLVPYHM